jgi:hypothetical protein
VQQKRYRSTFVLSLSTGSIHAPITVSVSLSFCKFMYNYKEGIESYDEFILSDILVSYLLTFIYVKRFSNAILI